ncbi:RES family NAD+ phosphorylase [Cupriavidus pauculus]|uniref:RES family NAD+ phosphorylase n=1 Tax=Cupriavidus pauculus TaxID=82633 RepID=UPI001EE2F8FE|nr:RES family NAD+ phosphorylase [Cupriavidus pauculus]GJG94914.1 RES domain-containing protein [Cupriavidus pauculus]
MSPYARDNPCAPMPPRSHLIEILADSVCVLRRGTWLVRAARSPEQVLPESVSNTYRWGPPDSARNAEAGFPFYWVYAAEDVATAVWEGQFCKTSKKRPGFFKVDRGAAETGLLAVFRLETDLPLLELGGSTGTRLGLYDRISQPNHKWCQRLGMELHHVLSELHPRTGVIGIRYPSRRMRNRSAVAIHSDYLKDWRRSITVQTSRFGQMPFHRELRRDPCCLAEVENRQMAV